MVTSSHLWQTSSVELTTKSVAKLVGTLKRIENFSFSALAIFGKSLYNNRCRKGVTECLYELYLNGMVTLRVLCRHSRLMRYVDLNAPDTDPVFALVYGASGTGKTHLMGTLGELGQVLIIDIDQGIKTLRNAPDLLEAHYTDNITVVNTMEKLYMTVYVA